MSDAETGPELRVSQRIAAALAHELRNPAFAIASAAQLLRYRLDGDPVVERNLGRILRETERLNTLIEGLLEYGTPAPLRLAAGDPDEVWIDIAAHSRGPLESKALHLRHTAAAPRASCLIDAEQLSTAFGNALANAIDAADSGTDLVIESAVEADGRWRSSLTNRGTPMAPEIAERVGEPFVTSKPGHAGLGLAIAHRIMHDHAGGITVRPGQGPGTIVTFSLPTRIP